MSNVDDGELVLGHPANLYGHAVLHLLVTVGGGKWRLVFAFVELLPREVPPPLHDGSIQGPQLKKSNQRMFADHVPISLQRGLTWYDDARAGRVVRSERDGTVPAAADPGATLCEGFAWAEEPPWPEHVCAASNHPLPFQSRWHQTPRVHHLIPTEDAWNFPPEDAALVDGFLEEQFGFRRSAWPQLAGSIHLIVPNPYFRSVEERLGGVRGAETISLTLEARAQVAVPPMRALLVEHRPTGLGAVASTSVTPSPTTVLAGALFHETSLRVDLQSGGTLYVRERAPFMRQVRLQMDIAGDRRRVEVKDEPGTVIETYEVAITHPEVARHVGDATSSPATTTLTEMMHEVEVREAAQSLEQHWFARNPSAARDFVRSRIQLAREQVMAADPFLGGIEVQRYALAVPLVGVPVRLLTTSKGFNDVFTPAWLLAFIKQWKVTQPSLGDIDVRVMTRDELHDRFLRVDNRLYTLGNSLNSLGDRASLVMRIPDPAPVFLELERLWDDAQTLADFTHSWLLRKQATPASPPPPPSRIRRLVETLFRFVDTTCRTGASRQPTRARTR